MNAEKNKRAVTVGIFVTLGIVILIAGIFTLGGQHKTFVPSFTVTSIFDDVTGLQQGNNVWFSGVKIGTVKRINFYGGSQVRVTMSIDRKAQDFIRKDAKTHIGSEGFIGNKLIVVAGGTPTAGPVEDGDTLRSERSLSTDEMMATLQENNKNLITITSDFKVVSRRLVNGEGTIGALLNDSSLYRTLEGTIANLKRAAHNSEVLTRGVADYTAQLQKPGTLASGLVHDTVIMSNLQAAVEQINQTAAATHDITTNLRTASEKLNSHNSPLGILLNDQESAQHIRQIMENLNSSSQKLDEDLEAAQHNFLLRRFFRRKARQEAKEKKQQEQQATQQ